MKCFKNSSYQKMSKTDALTLPHAALSFGLLWVESRDFSQADKEITACKAEQIHRMTPIFTQNNNLSDDSCQFCEFAQFGDHPFWPGTLELNLSYTVC